jgi:hypothetical protein
MSTSTWPGPATIKPPSAGEKEVNDGKEDKGWVTADTATRQTFRNLLKLQEPTWWRRWGTSSFLPEDKTQP